MAATLNSATTFEELDFQPYAVGNGVQARTEYPNGYGASVVRFDGSYGSEDGLYELAVLHGGRLNYDTPITDDVIGYLSPERITELLKQIAALPAIETATV